MKRSWNGFDRPAGRLTTTRPPPSRGSRPPRRPPCRRRRLDLARLLRSERERSRRITRSPSASSPTRRLVLRPKTAPLARPHHISTPTPTPHEMATDPGAHQAQHPAQPGAAAVPSARRGAQEKRDPETFMHGRGPHCPRRRTRRSHWPGPRRRGFQARNCSPAPRWCRAPEDQPFRR